MAKRTKRKTSTDTELKQNEILRISETKVNQLIELYKKEECLWNTKSEEYTWQSFREAATQRIAKELDIKYFNCRHVKIKFKNLRNSYSHELKRIEKSIMDGDDPVYRPKVFWFEKIDSFLRPHVQARRTIKNFLHHKVIGKNESEDEVNEISNSEEEVENDDNEPEIKRSRPTPEIPSYDSNPNISNELLGFTLPELQNAISKLQNTGNSSRDDCFDSFGKYVASMLRSMPFLKVMSLQPKIVTLLVSESLNDEGTISQSDGKQFL